MLLKDILFALWFFAPAGLANAAPVFAQKIPHTEFMARPIDFGKSFRGKRIFGDHKTFRGFVFGAIFSLVTVFLQQYAYNHTAWAKSLSLSLNYRTLNVFLLGLLFAFGALGFDAIKSFFKRQFGFKSGATWFPFDQIDYIVGGLLLSSIVVDLRHIDYYWIGLIWFLLHPVATFIGWLLGLKDHPI